jgi:hypothetical protein
VKDRGQLEKIASQRWEASTGSNELPQQLKLLALGCSTLSFFASFLLNCLLNCSSLTSEANAHTNDHAHLSIFQECLPEAHAVSNLKACPKMSNGHLGQRDLQMTAGPNSIGHHKLHLHTPIGTRFDSRIWIGQEAQFGLLNEVESDALQMPVLSSQYAKDEPSPSRTFSDWRN